MRHIARRCMPRSTYAQTVETVPTVHVTFHTSDAGCRLILIRTDDQTGQSLVDSAKRAGKRTKTFGACPSPISHLSRRQADKHLLNVRLILAR